jgi:hypothetical protein
MNTKASHKLRSEHVARELCRETMDVLELGLERDALGLEAMSRRMIRTLERNAELILEMTGGNEYTDAYRVRLTELKRRIAQRDCAMTRMTERRLRLVEPS